MSIDTDHIDALLKRADPADALSQVGPDSPKGREIWERVLAATSLGTSAPPLSRPKPRRPRWLILPALSVGAAAAAAILVLQLLPAPALRAPSASAGVLQHLAEKAAAVQPTPILKNDQWIQSEFLVSYLVAPPHQGPESAALQSARAVVTVNAENWANDLSQYCSQQVVTSVVYNSLAGQQAWSSSGIGVPSTMQPGCGSGFLGGQDRGTLDVARLPTDPAALAKALERGTTAIAALDRPFHGFTPFGRAVGFWWVPRSVPPRRCGRPCSEQWQRCPAWRFSAPKPRIAVPPGWPWPGPPATVTEPRSSFRHRLEHSWRRGTSRSSHSLPLCRPPEW